MRKKLSVPIILLLSVLVLSMFASTYLVPTASAKKPKDEYEFWWDVYLDYTLWIQGLGYPYVMDVESSMEWMEELDYSIPFFVIEQYVTEDGEWLFQHYVACGVSLLGDYKVQGSFDYHFVAYWEWPLGWPFWGENNWGYHWFENAQGYFEGIAGNGELWVELYELEMPPDDEWKLYTVQHTVGTINIGDPE